MFALCSLIIYGAMVALLEGGRDRQVGCKALPARRGIRRRDSELRIAGVPARLRRITRRGCKWIELDLALSPDVIQLTLRPRLQAVRNATAELCIDDATFDAMFQVEAAPADVARELLDADVRAALVHMGGPWIVQVEGGLRLARPGHTPTEVAELIALARALALGVEAAYRAADRGSVARRGAPFRPTLDGPMLAMVEYTRREELARMRAAERRDLQKRLARVAIAMVAPAALLLLL